MEVPSHHLKQKVCVSRPPYREGRHAKAVKVYTVNNESVYLIIQGVPSVGATRELNKLCSSFGPVEEFRPLDEYPCEDKYTEVYLVKYKKIQSSRFAKRKLDEHSFFGGNLHVCYAPEYESLEETRDKLRDRRQVVAKKIRQHKNERAHHLQQRQFDVSHAESNAAGVNFRVPPLPSGTSMQHTNLEVPSLNQQSDAHAQFTSFSTASTPVSHYHGYGQPPSFTLTTNSGSVEPPSFTLTTNSGSVEPPSFTLATGSEKEPQSEDDPAHNLFQLPLPPKPFKASQQVERGNKDWRQYEYSKVPTAHASLPEGYDGRLNIPEYKIISVSSDSGFLKPESKGKDNLFSQPSQIVIRDYKVQKPALKFVPRQAVKAAAEAAASEQQAAEVTKTAAAGCSRDDNLRKNAFRLGKVQGPKEIQGRKRALPTLAQQSVNDTISSIRSKISKIIGEKVRKKP